MANPQRENGHIDIANEIIDKFCTYHLTGREWQVLWVILRKTYGWNKKEDQISLSQFEILTDIPVYDICKIVNKLTKRGIIQKNDTIPSSYSFVKDYDKWVLVKSPVAKKPLVNRLKGTGKKANQVLVNLPDTNTTITNTTIQKTREMKYPYLKDKTFINAFDAYLQTRKTKATEHAKDLILRDLHEYNIKIAVAMIEQSIKNGYIGIFPLKNQDKGKVKSWNNL